MRRALQTVEERASLAQELEALEEQFFRLLELDRSSEEFRILYAEVDAALGRAVARLGACQESAVVV